MGFKIKVGYKPGLAAVQVDRPGMTFLETAHEIYFTQRTSVSNVADNKCLPGAPQIHLPVRILPRPYPVVFICGQKQRCFRNKFIHHFKHSSILNQAFICLYGLFSRSTDKMPLDDCFV